MADKVERMKMGKSPKGIAVYPRLNKPDTKFSEEGEYKVGLRVDPNEPEAAAYIGKLTKFAADNKALCGKGKLPIDNHVGDDGQPSGDVIIKFKVKSQWKDGSSRKPAIVGADKKPLDANVGGGSTIRVSGEASTYAGFGGGITLAPKAVQVLDLQTWNAGVDDFDDEGVDEMPPHDGGGDEEPEF